MAKIPYLVRRKNVFYFRLVVPVEFRESVNAREIIRSLKTENRHDATHQALKLAAHYKAALHDLKTGKVQQVSHLLQPEPKSVPSVAPPAVIPVQVKSSAPLLSAVIADFLNRYDQNNKVTLAKLNTTMPIFLELMDDRPVNGILQAHINAFFDEVQRLPPHAGNSKKYEGMTLREIIAANTGESISAGTFKSTYRALISIFLNWAAIHYQDQGFPTLSVQGAVYRGERSRGINKQRAATKKELQKLFGHAKMKLFSADPESAHFYWLPLIGLHTGARINEVCQLNPQTDIVQDEKTGIWFFAFTDEGEAAEGVEKSIKTESSRRVVPVHSRLIELGFLNYVERIKAGGHKQIFPQWKPRYGKASIDAKIWFTNYIGSIGLKDETPGARLSGFHAFRHGFITYAITNKISGVFQITGHEVESVDGFGKISKITAGYWSKGKTDNILELKQIIECFDFGIDFYKPV
ncbi:site-specific integrase [Methylomicrobium sp. Wu6]|uniref:site-specific integrase n=1 Tax=Methylomicrobium sp. Wu6 TaxID=3107928 RepID=UPI002DD66AB1|nr:site-specific integrase [Methylomicrobium sp. Wu6]MEC4747711.1 site-specific integrase [Methylomicrobium sp. Wu6]